MGKIWFILQPKTLSSNQIAALFDQSINQSIGTLSFSHGDNSQGKAALTASGGCGQLCVLSYQIV